VTIRIGSLYRLFVDLISKEQPRQYEQTISGNGERGEGREGHGR